MNYRFNLVSIFIWLFINGILPGQSPFTIMGGQEAAITGAGAAVLGVSIPISHGVDPLTPEEVAALRAEDVWGLDRWGTRQWSPGAQRVSDKFLYGSFALPATMLLDRAARSEFDQVGLLTLESMLLSVGVTNLTKALVRRPRPFMYNPDVPLVLKTRRRSRYSFFSGHTSLTATSAFLTAKLYHDFYPDSDARPYVWATAAVIPAITGYLRVRGGKHYLTDVLIGYGVGAAIGVLVPQLHK